MNLNAYLKYPEKRGIALVIVLGMLSILVVLGVAFSIAMRTERLATRSYLNLVKARHLTQTALYRVLGETIENEMEDRIYPFEDAFYAPRSMHDLTLLGNFSSTSPVNFISMSVRTNLYELNDQGFDWQELRSPADNQFLGEYGYLVVNCSGLLDANVIGEFETNNPPREVGFDPGEIRFSIHILPEADANTLYKYRAAFRRFESVPELYYLTSTTEFKSELGPQPLKQLTRSMADHLHVFSRYPRGAANPDLTANTNVAYVGGDPKNWDIPAIRSALLDDDLGSLEPNPIPNVNHFISALYDYASEGYELHGATDKDKFERISSKRVPMINEIAISNQLVLTSADADDPDSQHTLIHRVYVVVETWYPFTESDGSEFRVQYGAGGGQEVKFTKPPPIPSIWPEMDGMYSCVETNLAPPGSGADFVPTPNSYQLTTFVFEARRTAATGADLPLPPPNEMTFAIELDLQPIRVLYGGAGQATNDLVLAEWPTIDLEESVQLVANGGPITLGTKGYSVNDPRINWDPSTAAGQWSGAAPTLGAFNTDAVAGAQQDELPRGGIGPFDGLMYSRQGPSQYLGEERYLRSVGEVGYLLYSAERPWETVRLLNPDPDNNNTARILDRLTVHSNEFRRGLVNVNSQQPRALATAMWNLPLKRYPNQASGNTLVTNDAIRLAEVLADNTYHAPMANISEFKDKVGEQVINDIFSQTELDAPGSKFLRESVLRNSVGVLGTRHNLFTVFIAARVYSDAYDPDNASHRTNRVSFLAAEQRAVAVVWRDPLETVDSDGNKTHKSMVQYFHWLTGVFEDE